LQQGEEEEEGRRARARPFTEQWKLASCSSGSTMRDDFIENTGFSEDSIQVEVVGIERNPQLMSV
jgi:hypothetical protein